MLVADQLHELVLTDHAGYPFADSHVTAAVYAEDLRIDDERRGHNVSKVW